ncbi:E3 ubiquitin-protein ligase bre1 [Mortierella sp. GBA43]|nr:E3 ubiquitin-protein ligase bre1 [Mortierella sp. GBA43]
MTAAETVLLNYQKEAIWRQMQEYKREAARVEERITRRSDKQADHDDQINIVNTYWNKLLDDLKALVLDAKIDISRSNTALKDGSNLASILMLGTDGDEQGQEVRELTEGAVKTTVEASSRQIKDITLELLHIIEAWANQRSGFCAATIARDPAIQESAAIQQLSSEYSNTTLKFNKRRVEVDRLQAKCHGFTDHILRLKNELEMTRNRIRETVEEMRDSTSKLQIIEGDIEREKRAMASATMNNSDMFDPATSTVSAWSDLSSATKDDLLRFRKLATSRLEELEEMKAQRTQLKEELDKARSELEHLSDEKIQDSQHARGLLFQIQSIRHEADHYRGEVLRLRADLDDMRTSRRKFTDALELEEKNRRATLEADLKKLESDISRVRDSRDRFQQLYENRCTKDDYEMQQNQEIRKIANTRKDRITALTTEIQRLETLLTTTSDDWESYAFYLKTPSDKATLHELRGNLKLAEEQIKSLGIELEASKEATLQNRDLANVIVSENQLKGQLETLTTRLAQVDLVIGSKANDNIKELVATIEAKDESIKRLELKVRAHDAVQTPLLNELHTVASAWGQLEEATSRKAIDLAMKEDLIYKLLSDKTRQESKCSNLIKAKEQSANMTAVMKRQSDMQLDQIRRLEEREKALSQQMVTLEKEQIVLNNEVSVHKTKLQEYTQQNATFKEKFTKQEERLTEMQALVKERSDAFENETLARKRLQEESETMRRKIEENVKKSESSSGDSEAAKQAAQYLKLLKCPACDVNFKSHVILRCMHVFCKNCMDKQMEYRQRKCPTCRENFGAKDVKEIYL